MQERVAAFLNRIRVPLLAACAAVVLFLAWIGLDGSLAGWERDRVPELQLASLGDRILVVAPHPDDETLAVGGLVREALAAGKHVRVCVVTCGDGYRRILPRYQPKGTSDTAAGFAAMGAARAAESREALGVLGLGRDDVVFLGYPDGTLSALWRDDWAAGTGCLGANGRRDVRYPFAYRPGAPYTGSSLTSDVASVVDDFAPTAVVFPDSEDANGDHWALNAFTQVALDRGGFRGRRLSYLVHRGHFPFPWSYLPKGLMEPPKPLRSVGVEWRSLRLSRETEALKEDAVHAYRSQRLVMEPFLDAFVRRNELFGESASAEAGVLAAGMTPSLDATAMPGVVVRDPAADTLLRLLDPPADIREVAVVRSDGELLLGVRLQGPVSRDVTYRLCARMLRDDGAVTRADIEVRKGTAKWLRIGAEALSGPAPRLTVARDRVWIALPREPFAQARETLVYAETMEAGVLVDRSAVRAARMP
jgi:LmbE family N-acetylglucosaminyl deacetylase